MIYLVSLLILAQLLLVIVMWGIWQELRKTREAIQTYVQGLRLASTHRRTTVTTEGALGYEVFAVWVWRAGNWELDKDTVPAGHEAGLPPAFPGAFEGDRVRVQCSQQSVR